MSWSWGSAFIADVSYNEAIELFDPVKLGDSLQDAIEKCVFTPLTPAQLTPMAKGGKIIRQVDKMCWPMQDWVMHDLNIPIRSTNEVSKVEDLIY